MHLNYVIYETLNLNHMYSFWYQETKCYSSKSKIDIDKTNIIKTILNKNSIYPKLVKAEM